MSKKIGEIFVSLGLSTASFTKNLEAAKNLSFDTSREIERSMKIIGTATLSAFAAAGGALTLLTKQAIDNADRMGKLAQTTGMSVEKFSALAFAANRSDIETATLAKGLVILAKNLEKANQQTLEGKAAHSALSTLFRGNIPVFQDTNAAFQQIAAKLSQLPDGYQKTALAAQIFGKSGALLIPMLDTLTEVTERFKRMGLEVSGPTAARAAEFNERLKDLKAGVSVLGLGIASELLPKLIQLATAFGEVNRAGLGHILGREAANAIIVWQKVGVAILLASAQIELAKQRMVGFDTTKMQATVNDLRNALDELRNEQAETLGEVVWLPRGKPGKATADPAAMARAAAAAEAAAAAQKKLQDALKSTNEKLQQEFLGLNFSADGLELMKLKTLGATTANLNYTASLQEALRSEKQILAGQAATRSYNPIMPSSNELDTSFQKQIEAGAQIFERTRTEMEKMGLALAQDDELLKAGAISLDTWQRDTAKLKENLTAGGAGLSDFQRGLRSVRSEMLAMEGPLFNLAREMWQFGERSLQAFGDWLIVGDSFRQMLQGIVQDLARIIFKLAVIDPLMKSIFEHSGGGGGGGFFSSLFGALLGGLFGGVGGGGGGSGAGIGGGGVDLGGGLIGAAGGGPAFRGVPMWVGEKGPEVFWPDSNGSIVPNDKLGGFGGGVPVVQNFNIDNRGADAGTTVKTAALVNKMGIEMYHRMMIDRQQRMA